jgi:hypothetical protein
VVHHARLVARGACDAGRPADHIPSRARNSATSGASSGCMAELRRAGVVNVVPDGEVRLAQLDVPLVQSFLVDPAVRPGHLLAQVDQAQMVAGRDHQRGAAEQDRGPVHRNDAREDDRAFAQALRRLPLEHGVLPAREDVPEGERPARVHGGDGVEAVRAPARDLDESPLEVVQPRAALLRVQARERPLRPVGTRVGRVGIRRPVEHEPGEEGACGLLPIEGIFLHIALLPARELPPCRRDEVVAVALMGVRQHLRYEPPLRSPHPEAEQLGRLVPGEAAALVLAAAPTGTGVVPADPRTRRHAPSSSARGRSRAAADFVAERARGVQGCGPSLPRAAAAWCPR